MLRKNIRKPNMLFAAFFRNFRLRINFRFDSRRNDFSADSCKYGQNLSVLTVGYY